MNLKDFDKFVEDYCGQCHSRRYCDGGFECDTINAMDLEPTIDAVPVVRCKDCNFYVDEDGVRVCEIWESFHKKASPPPDGFCHAGIKRKDIE